jgi:DNA polymerase-3 subunit delta'
MSVWDDLIGQDETVAVLRGAAAAAADQVAGRAVDAGRMTHAWLFTGPAGSGRSVAARALAAALQCERVEDVGCGQCNACRTVRARTHPDVHSVVPEGLSISVAEMRAVVGRAARRPARGRWQVIVIEDADRLTEQAANALLKAVEEPPERSVFLLCAPSTHPDDVSVTIRSSCRLVSLRTPGAAAVASVLEADGVDESTARWAAAAGQGHVGRSRRLARDPQARERRAAVLAIPASLTSLRACLDAADRLVGAAEAESAALSAELDADETEALRIALGAGGTGKGTATSARGAAGAVKDLERRQKSRATRTQRDALDRALVDLAAFYRDALLVQAVSAGNAVSAGGAVSAGSAGAGSAPPLAHPDFAEDTQAVAAQIAPAGVLQRLDAVLACREALDLNVKPRIAVEAMTAALRLP